MHYGNDVCCHLGIDSTGPNEVGQPVIKPETKSTEVEYLYIEICTTNNREYHPQVLGPKP